MGNWDNRNSSGYYGNKSSFEDKSETKKPIEIKTFYKEGTKIPLPDLFDKNAADVADSFVGKNKKGFEIGVSSTQLRRIFDEVKRYEQILSQPDAKWDEQLPYIKMIKSKVAYSVARAAKNKPEEKGVYSNLEKFISSSINLIRMKKTTMYSYHSLKRHTDFIMKKHQVVQNNWRIQK